MICGSGRDGNDTDKEAPDSMGMGCNRGREERHHLNEIVMGIHHNILCRSQKDGHNICPT